MSVNLSFHPQGRSINDLKGERENLEAGMIIIRSGGGEGGGRGMKSPTLSYDFRSHNASSVVGCLPSCTYSMCPRCSHYPALIASMCFFLGPK